MLVHHRLRLLAFPMRTTAVCRRWPNVGSPRYRRDPFVRDGVFDLGRASAPRITVPHMLPSATLKASASAILLLSRLNRPPCTIAVYASPWSSPPTTQHSLPGGRYPLPRPDIHRLDLASFLAHSCCNSAGLGCLKLNTWQPCGLTPDITCLITPSLPAASSAWKISRSEERR